MPADRLLESAIRAMVMSDQAALRSLEELAHRAAPPENWERYFTFCAVYKGLLQETGRNLRMLRRATGREPTPVTVRQGVPSETNSGEASHGNPDHRV